MIRRRNRHERCSTGPVGPSSPSRPVHRDDGFTLIELVIVMTIIPIVIAGISAAIITSFKDQVGIANRLSDSFDAQLTAAYFVPDVESATYITNSVSSVPCESSLATAGLLLRLDEMTPTQNEEIFYVDNALGYNPDGQQNALLRIVCTGNGFATPAAVGAVTIVAHSLSASTAATVTIACSPAPNPPPQQYTWLTWTPCRPSGGSAPGIANVTITVPERPTNSANVALDDYTYSQSATPREWVPDTAAVTGGAQLPGLLALGSNMTTGANLVRFVASNTTPPTTLTTTQATPTGDIDVDSSSAGSVSMIGGDQINPLGKFSVFNCQATANTACPNSTISKTGANNVVTEAPVSAGAAIQDPLSNLPLPSFTATGSPVCQSATQQFTSTIAADDQVITCSAGVYPSGLNISGQGDIITFANQGASGAVFQFGSQNCNKSKCAGTGLTVAGQGDKLIFESADFVFDGSTADTNSCTTGVSGGLSNSNAGGINIKGGGDTLQDNGTGVFFYVAGGPADFGCGVSPDNTISLSPMTSGPYEGVLLFQRSTGTSQLVVLDGFTTSGTIYVPDSVVETVGNVTNSTGSLIVQDLDLDASLTIT